MNVNNYKPSWSGPPPNNSAKISSETFEEKSSPSYIEQKTKKMMKPLRSHVYLKKIMPYKWNSIFKDEEMTKRKASTEFLDDPLNFLKDICDDDDDIGHKELSEYSVDDLPFSEDKNISLCEEIFLELGVHKTLGRDEIEDDETEVKNLSDLEKNCDGTLVRYMHLEWQKHFII